MTELLAKGNVWSNIKTFFDIIPKVVYFLYAALASGVDALQALIRKLAGLDKYWAVNGTGNATGTVVGQDPLMEFVNGILGVGNSASVYKALNTVFWSLAIFGLIMLVVSTMIAIIKSHYNEDTAGTSPWKYIYTAVKAILTFAIIPLVVVLGMQLSNFALNTLDKIIAGSADGGQVEGIYGSSAREIFESSLEDPDTSTESQKAIATYGHYDFFGARDFTTSTPFSGMLFKAAGYNANRVRSGEMTSVSYNAVTTHGVRIFGQASDTSSDYVAYQVDYAFANCLMFKDEYRASYDDWVTAVNDEVAIWRVSDIFHLQRISGFSKWDVSVVWMFYDLWKFNFIVGFAGVTACFGIMVSIVFGLLTRLIKGAALFLVFPALLGIAPMDNFKAFKSWGSQFMQQVLMVFGAIVGMNLLLLILPYIQNIKFFDPTKKGLGVLNAIMDVVILVVGLQMAKDFINIVNGFVGGADAVGAGDGVKEGTMKSLKTGAKMTLAAGKLGAMGYVAGGKLAFKGARAGIRGATNRSAFYSGEVRSTNETVRNRKAQLATAKEDLSNAEERKRNAESVIKEYDDAHQTLADVNGTDVAKRNARIRDFRKAHQDATLGKTDDEVADMITDEATTTMANISPTLSLERAKLAQSNLDINSANARIGTLEGDGAGSVKEAENARSQVFKKAERWGFDIADDRSGVIKRRLNTRAHETGVYDSEGNMLDKDGEVTTNPSKQATKQVEGTGIYKLASVGKDFGALAGNMFKKTVESMSWSSIGKNIADSFSKSVQNSASTFGFDKLGKDIADTIGTIKQTTLKAPDSLGGLEGDKLVKKTAEEQKGRDDKMAELLKQIVENTKPKDNK